MAFYRASPFSNRERHVVRGDYILTKPYVSQYFLKRILRDTLSSITFPLDIEPTMFGFDSIDEFNGLFVHKSLFNYVLDEATLGNKICYTSVWHVRVTKEEEESTYMLVRAIRERVGVLVELMRTNNTVVEVVNKFVSPAEAIAMWTLNAGAVTNHDNIRLCNADLMYPDDDPSLNYGKIIAEEYVRLARTTNPRELCFMEEFRRKLL